ncbi:hypothetical protein [Vibrio sp. ER1A]|uniref:hypothetical protein n=1 Tax=Vibrio sp. ER1A TaxID=1517681 RepID=UPI001268C0BA|nr:hypothetical protein [Vibrio sp. ER1A]
MSAASRTTSVIIRVGGKVGGRVRSSIAPSFKPSLTTTCFAREVHAVSLKQLVAKGYLPLVKAERWREAGQSGDNEMNTGVSHDCITD